MRKITAGLLIIALMMTVLPWAALAASVQNVSVAVHPLTPNTAGQYTIGFYTSSTGSLTGGADNIIINFPAGTYLPSSIGNGRVTVNGVSVSSSGLDTDGDVLTIELPKSVDVKASGYVGIIIQESAGIKTAAKAGNQYIYVSTSKDSAKQSNAFSLEGTRITNLAVEVSPAVVDEYAAYEINFRTSSKGELEGGEDYIYIEFAEEVRLPSSVSGSYVTVNGKKLSSGDVGVDRNKKLLTLELPSAIDIDDSDDVEIKISVSARIRNPEDSGEYEIRVYTSRDAYYRADEYSIGDTASIPVVHVSPRKADTAAQYSVGFTTSDSGALTAGTDYIYLYFPEGSYIPSSINKSYITINGYEAGAVSITRSSLRVGVRLPSGLNIKDDSYVVVVVQSKAGIRNPEESGEYRLGVSTTADSSRVYSEEYDITGGGSSSSSDSDNDLEVRLSNNKAGAVSQYHIVLVAEEDYDWEEDDLITVTFPSGTTLPSSIAADRIVIDSVYADRVSVSGNSLRLYLEDDLSIEEDDSISILIPESVGVKNPSKGTYTLSVKFPGEDRIVTEPYTITASSSSTTSSKKMVFKIGSTLHTVDGVLQTMEAAPAIISGRAIIPVRAVGDFLSAQTSYNETNRTVLIKISSKEIMLAIGLPQARVNGAWVNLDSPATIINGRTLVPVRFISEHFGATVSWDAASQEVTVIK